jgi:sarcosine oxidase, subunit delta
MLIIACPWCGPRPETEFRCGGQSHVQRPGPHDAVSDPDWANYLFYRKNSKGVEHERWVHRHGCGQWFNLSRDTIDHRIHAVYAMTDPCPDLGQA